MVLSSTLVVEAMLALWSSTGGLLRVWVMVYDGGASSPEEETVEEVTEIAAESEELQLFSQARNPSVEVYAAYYRGYPIPHVSIQRWPVNPDGSQAYPEVHSGADGVRHYDPPGGNPTAFVWTLTVDDRWAYDYERESDLRRVLPLLADAMAVAAGFACHGSSNRLNLHGPVVLQAHQDSPAGEVQFG